MIVSGAVIFGSVIATSPAIAEEPTETTTVSGFVTVTSTHGEAAERTAPFLLRVPGQGYLNVDYSAIDLSQVAKAKTEFELEVPAGIDLGSSSDSKFDALLDASLEAPLAVVDTVSSGFESRVNVSPVTTAAHKIYAVAVTPGNSANIGPDATQTPAAIAANVSASSAYWSSQSTGKVKFSLEGTTSWYKSGTSCDVEVGANAAALFNQARGVAMSQLGYEEAYNTHLVLIFPANSDCNGAAGLGTVGNSVNEGGVLWAIGGVTNYEKQTLSHELGHNLSLGHASMLVCDDSTPNPAAGECDVAPYGDRTDVMGYGSSSPDLQSGALGSAQAIRSGLWSSSAYTIAKQGTTSHTLLPISGNTGKRAVEIVGKSGTSYFVEYRNYTGEDAGYKSPVCVPQVCSGDAAGIRIIRLQPNQFGEPGDEYSINGLPGDDSLVFGRSFVSGTPTINYKKGQSFSLDGIKVAVSDVTSKSAKIKVTRSTPTAWAPLGGIVPSVQMMENKVTAGDVYTVIFESGWVADSLTFQWQRASATGAWASIKGATKQSYTLGASDIDKYVRVKITAKHKGYQTYTAASNHIGTVEAGVLDTGTVTIDNSATPLTAKLTSWLTPSVTYSYQWLRDGTAISKATKSTYSPVSSDSNKQISVTVTAKKSGFPTAVVTSAPVSVTITAGGTATLTGAAQVGEALQINEPSFSASRPVTVTYQWYRSGTAIKGKTASSYTLTSADLSKVITAKVTATAAGHVTKTLMTPATAKVAKGVLEGTNSASITPGATLTAVSGITESGVTKKYQWYVGGKAVSKATKSTYTPKASDSTKEIKVTITVSKSGFTTLKATAILPPL